jgi:hypothetical protein
VTLKAIVQLLLPFMRKPRGKASEQAARGECRAKPPARKRASRPSQRQASYDLLVNEMKAEHGFRVRKWRRSMSGCAWELRYRDGRRQRMLEAPYPKSPLSCSIFLHEVGHHAIGLGSVRPRCLEELRAWEWSLAAMASRGLDIDDKVRTRVQRSMEYAVAKAARRGIKTLPEELLAYAPRPRATR